MKNKGFWQKKESFLPALTADCSQPVHIVSLHISRVGHHSFYIARKKINVKHDPNFFVGNSMVTLNRKILILCHKDRQLNGIGIPYRCQKWSSTRKQLHSLFSTSVLFQHSDHRLNMELDLQRLFGLSCIICWDPATPPPPTYTRALLVSQDRRHLFVNPWSKVFESESATTSL